MKTICKDLLLLTSEQHISVDITMVAFNQSTPSREYNGVGGI